MAHGMMELGLELVFTIMVLAYAAATYDVVKKLKNKEGVPDSTIGFVNMGTVSVLVVSSVAILYLGYQMYKGGKSMSSGSVYYY